MEKAEIIEIVNSFLIEEFELDAEDLSPEAHLMNDLEIESLDFVDIVVIIEKDFGFKVKNEDLTNLRTLDDLYNYIYDQKNAPA
ncbi:MAG: acyl carrier protein [Bacteroidales bacterium]|nr:acyl carrier protein [Bacteroidales bacterium]